MKTGLRTLLSLVLLSFMAGSPSWSALAASTVEQNLARISPESGKPMNQSRSVQNPASLQAASSGFRMQMVTQFEEASYFIQNLDFISSTTGWAMGEPHWDQASRSYLGTILRTKDTGGTWDLQPIGGSETLKAVDFVDGSQGWAAGYNGTIVHTSDGGAHWVQQTVATRDEFRDLFFWDANQGWATSIHPSHYDSFGLEDDWKASIWHTSNGEATWVSQALPQDASILNHIQFVDALQGWAVGIRYTGEDYSGPLHRAAVNQTSDGGATWQLQYAPDVEFTLTGVNFVDAKQGWAVGFRFGSSGYGGSVFHTTDGGAPGYGRALRTSHCGMCSLSARTVAMRSAPITGMPLAHG